MNPHRQPVVHQRRNPNLQEPSITEDCACFIPTIVNGATNGVTNVNPHSVNVPIYNESTKNLIHNLRESINEHNKKKDTHSKKHKIILIGDSHIKGYASNLKSLLSNNYDFFIIFKPGSTTNELMESAKKINSLQMML